MADNLFERNFIADIIRAKKVFFCRESISEVILWHITWNLNRLWQMS